MKSRIAVLMVLGVLVTGHSFAQVETHCSTSGTSNSGQINSSTDCTSTDTGAAQAERTKQNDEAMSTMGNAMGVLIGRSVQAHHYKKEIKKYCSEHPGEDWFSRNAADAIVDRGTCPGDINPAIARTDLINNFNRDFKKNGVAGYAEIVGDTFMLHSERASGIRFKMVLQEPVGQSRLKMMKGAGITTYVYTNDADVNLSYDLKSSQIVKATQESAAQAAQK